MFVTLAYPHEGHAPDETVDLDDVTARRLVRDGLARRAAPPVPTVADEAHPPEETPDGS